MILSSLNHTLCPLTKVESFRGSGKTDPYDEGFAENVSNYPTLV
jgi:hypothetical protein